MSRWKRYWSAMLVVAMLIVALAIPTAATRASSTGCTFTGTVAATGTAWKSHKFEVTEKGAVSVTLDWDNAAADLNMFLINPGGTIVVQAVGSDKPEELSYNAGWKGTWTLGVKAKKGTGSYTASLTKVGCGTTNQQTFTGSVTAGGAAWLAHDIDLTARALVSATLSWSSSADLNLFLKAPDGTIVASATTNTSPEKLDYTAETSGVWKLGAKARSGSADYLLVVETSGGDATTGPPVPAQNSIRVWAVENEAPSQNLTEAQAVEDARLFDLITATKNAYRGYVGAMKQVNPDVILLTYLNAAFAQKNQGSAFPASWYARDELGRKIQSTAFGNYLMNPSHPGWIDNRVRLCVDLLQSTRYDGCALDMMGPAPLLSGYTTSLPINPATGKTWTKSEWMAATDNLARQVKKAVAPALVFGNGLGYGPRYFNGAKVLLNGIDGGIAEIFIRTAGQGIGSYRSEASWKKDVDMLVDAGNRGKPVLALTKVWVNGTAAQKDIWHKYAYASFLLGTDGNSYFTFSYGRNTDPTKGHPWWEIQLGQPLGNYATAGGLYHRAFSGGFVVVNPTGSKRSMELGATYRDLTGKLRASVTLAPHTAEIFTTP